MSVLDSSGWASISLSASLLFAGHGHLETRWFTIPKTYWDNTWKYMEICGHNTNERRNWLILGMIIPCGYQVIIPSLGILAVIPVIIDASAGTVRRLGRDWKDVEIPVDSGRFWSSFVHLSPHGFLPTFPALRCCKVTEDFYETTRCYEDGRCCHGSRLWFSCVGRMLAASSSCHSHRPGFVGCRVESRITLHQPLGRLMNKCSQTSNISNMTNISGTFIILQTQMDHDGSPHARHFKMALYDRRVTSWSGTIWPRPNGFTWMGPSSWSMMRRIAAVAPLNDDFAIFCHVSPENDHHYHMVISHISNSSVWMMIVENHYFNPVNTAEMAEIKQGGFVGKSWDEMGHET